MKLLIINVPSKNLKIGQVPYMVLAFRSQTLCKSQVKTNGKSKLHKENRISNYTFTHLSVGW